MCDKGVRNLNRDEWCFLYSPPVSSSARESRAMGVEQNFDPNNVVMVAVKSNYW